MSRYPRVPLTPEERALAAQLPRVPGRSEPDAMLDARILAAARAAVAPPPALRPRMRWIAPLAVAASLSLAVGLAWRLQPPAAPGAGAPKADDAMTEMPEARMATSPPDPVQERHAISPPPLASEHPSTNKAPAVNAPAAIARQQLPPPVPPPAPPAPPAAASMVATQSAAAADMVAAPTAAPASSPAMAKAAGTTESMRERPAASAGAAPRSQANQATIAADAAAEDPQAFLMDEPGEDVPPATVDSPEVRDAWLRRIGTLLQVGRKQEAEASLAEFRRRYPDATLPPELRKLGP